MDPGRLWGRGVEWDEVRTLLAREADTPMGQERALCLEPRTDPGAVRRLLAETREGRQALQSAGPPPWGTVPDVRPTLERARIEGALLEGAELVALVPLIEAGGRLRAYGQSTAAAAPGLAATCFRLPGLTPLRELLSRSLTPEGALTDEASPRLRQIRRKIRERREEIVKLLDALFQTQGAEAIFQDRYVTIRHGRYVVPVRAEALARVRGIVHDRSHSGATLFVEPDKAVELNNNLVQAVREEEAEALRILQALTDEVRSALPDLEALVEGIGGLDLVFARAELAERMTATEPDLDPGRTVALSEARHPLLLAQSWQEPGRPVVPVDLHLDALRPLLIITGPNAGGKTVALKTLGILALMCQAGCHLPVREASKLPVFRQVFAVIGDDQSVAENLSTFSAFVKQVREILEEVDARSLVLLDELGAGTDPDEGAALAQAILEDLQARGALVMATTHLEPLKAFASTHPGARNASVEFDGGRLAPTFRLLYDRPGQSYALTIAARLGLPEHLIDRAHSHRSTQAQHLQELLARLDADTRTASIERGEAERRQTQAATLLARAQKELEAAQAKAKETLARAKAEAQTLLADIRRKVAEEWERLRSEERSRRSLEATRKRLAEAAPPMPAPAPPRTVALAPSWRDSVRTPEKAAVPEELMLLGKTTDEGRDLVEKYLDDAFLAGRRSVRLIHGKGTGALRKAVHEVLAGHPLVDAYKPESGGGATVVALKVD
ncbi:MAG: endonuclease MutS2 [Candidatus Rokuibacteriota bacterium]